MAFPTMMKCILPYYVANEFNSYNISYKFGIKCVTFWFRLILFIVEWDVHPDIDVLSVPNTQNGMSFQYLFILFLLFIFGSYGSLIYFLFAEGIILQFHFA